MTPFRRAGVAAIAAAMAACGGPTAPTEPIHVEVTDPAGDAVKPPFGRVPPDLVAGSVDVAGGSIAFTVRFGAGTYDPADTQVFIFLDVDEKLSTGVRNESQLGVDYWVDVASSKASISQCQFGNYCPSIGIVAPVFEPGGFTVSVPLTLLGGDDGRMRFRVKSDTVALSDRDFMPDLGLAAGRVK